MNKLFSVFAGTVLTAALIGAAEPAKPAKPAPQAAKQAEKGAVPKMSQSKADGLYKVGETIDFTVTGLPANAEFLISFDGDKTVNAKKKVRSDASGKITVSTKLGRPGFVRCAVSGKGIQRAVLGAGAEPEKIRGSRPMPADFEKYWADEKAALDKVPLEPEVKPFGKPNPKIKVFAVTIPCPGSKTPVRGYLAMPANAKAKGLPALLSVHAAGVRSSGIPSNHANTGYLAFDFNAHGIEDGRPKEFYRKMRNTELKEYWRSGVGDRKTLYFHGMFLRLYRALQFIKSRPEWNGKVLVVTGGSQGGMQSIAAAGLDPQVTMIAAHVPAGCDHGGATVGRDPGWPRYSGVPAYKKDPQKVLKDTDYIDCVNFARLIKNAKVFVSTGFIDTTCSSASVFAAFNEMPTKDKTIFTLPDTAHGTTVKPAMKVSYPMIREEAKR